MPDIKENIIALNEKIAALKKKQVNEAEKSAKHTDFSRMAVGLRLSVELVSGTFVGAALGYILDEIFDFKPLLLIVFTLFGGAAGMLNAVRYLKSSAQKKER